MSSHFTPFTLKDISRPGGGFAMLAVDQREAMRLMFAAAGQPKPIADSVLTDFKVAATRILSPYASAVLADKQFCLEQIVEQGAVANSCGLIVAADLFIPGNGIPVDSVEIDMSVDIGAFRIAAAYVLHGLGVEALAQYLCQIAHAALVEVVHDAGLHVRHQLGTALRLGGVHAVGHLGGVGALLRGVGEDARPLNVGLPQELGG